MNALQVAFMPIRPPKRFPSEERRPWKRDNVRGLTWGPPNRIERYS
jgi:hypothetical protein